MSNARENESLRRNTQLPARAESTLPSAKTIKIQALPPTLYCAAMLPSAIPGAKRKPPSSRAASDNPAGSHTKLICAGIPLKCMLTRAVRK